MAYLDTAYVDACIGTALRQALANTAAFSVFEKQARAQVQAAAQVAGYSLGNTSSNDMVQLLAVGQWYVFAGGLKKGLEVPDSIKASIDDLALVRDGKKPIPGLTPSTEDGIGGTKFSDTSGLSTSSRIQLFSRGMLRSW